jgi:general secretion pathway protein F
VILASAAGVSLIVLFLYVIPRFAVIFKDVGQAVPWITRVILGLSSSLTEYGWLIAIALIAAIAAGIFYLRNPETKSELDRVSLRLWLVGDLVRKFETARFSRTLSALLKGGVPRSSGDGAGHHGK